MGARRIVGADATEIVGRDDVAWTRWDRKKGMS